MGLIPFQTLQVLKVAGFLKNCLKTDEIIILYFWRRLIDMF